MDPACRFGGGAVAGSVGSDSGWVASVGGWCRRKDGERRAGRVLI
jgi:hypothetical protein